MKALRWMCVLPASILGAAVTTAFVMLLNFLASSPEDKVFLQLLQEGHFIGNLYFIMPFIFCYAGLGFSFIYCGAKTAPDHKRVCGFVLYTILAIILTVFSLLAIISGAYMPIIGSVIALVSAFFALRDVDENT